MKRIFFSVLFLCSLIILGVFLAHYSIVKAQSPGSYLYLNGPVGIGVASPVQKLEVAGSVLLQNNNNLYFKNVAGSGASGWSINPTAGGSFLIKEESLSITPFTILTSGNIGIGNTAPGVKLDVTGDIRGSNNLYLSPLIPQIISGGNYISIPYGLYIAGGTLYDATQAEFRGGIHNDSATYLQINGGTSGITYFNGNVGIGTTGPNFPLHVSKNGVGVVEQLTNGTTGSLSTDGMQFAFSGAASPNNDNFQFYFPENKDIEFYTNATERMRITRDGNVGIAKTNPAYPLDVTGDINFTGTLRQNGTAFGGSQWTGATGSNIYVSTGNVGIGNTGPGSQLEIGTNASFTGRRLRLLGYSTSGSADANLEIGDGGGVYWRFLRNSSNAFEMNLSNTLGIMGGNVGIGYTNPGFKLSVNGTLGATIMYDNNDGAYYVDPNGTSNINNLQVAGSITCIGNTCPPNGAIRLTPNLHLNSAAGNAVILNWDNGTTGNAQTLRIGNGASSDVFDVNANGNTFAPIYYDIQNSGYYVDPNGTSHVNVLNADGVISGSQFNGSGAGLTGTAGSLTVGNANALGGLGSGSFGQFNTWQNNHYSGTGGEEYATIFYDTNNGGYYVDPNGTTHLNVLNADGAINGSNIGQDVRNGANPTFGTVYTNNWFRSTGQSGWYNQDYGGGMYMTDTSWVRAYNSKGIWTNANMQAAQFIDDNNTGYYVDPNGTSRMGYINADNLGATNGDWFPYYDGINYIRGNVRFNGVLYDEGDTSYYVDPNNTSRFNSIQVMSMNDANDTSYYLDMNNTSHFQALDMEGTLTVRGNTNAIQYRDGQANGYNLRFLTGIRQDVTGNTSDYAFYSYGGNWKFWGGVVTGNFNNISSKTVKENFATIDTGTVLENIEKLPIMEWNYKEQDASVKHIGPFSEDFHDIFGLNGTDDKAISVADTAGVSLAGIKALFEKDKALEKKNQDLEKRVATLEEKQSQLESKLNKLLSK